MNLPRCPYSRRKSSSGFILVVSCMIQPQPLQDVILLSRGMSASVAFGVNGDNARSFIGCLSLGTTSVQLRRPGKGPTFSLSYRRKAAYVVLLVSLAV